MAKQPEFRKYLPLEEWFRKQQATAKQIELTFDQVEAILGTPLPASATKLRTWWTNVEPRIQSHRTAPFTRRDGNRRDDTDCINSS